MLTPQELESLRRLVYDAAGIVIDADKGYLFEARLGALVRRLGLPRTGDLVGLLEGDGAGELRRLTVEAMANGETLFFRDIAMFEMLGTALLPRLVAARASERRLRIWSAACSTGQEPYSVAMLLRDQFPEVQGWDLKLVATDLSVESIERARRGRYSQFEINRGLPAQKLVRHFIQREGEWEVSAEVRATVELRVLNLLREPPPPPGSLDLVFLRNVMIYWDVPTRRAVLERVRRALRPDGVLILGAAEGVFEADDLLTREGFPGASCYHPIQR